MGIGKAAKPMQCRVKHSLKEYFDQLDDALSEGGLSVTVSISNKLVKTL
jgi:hypothetical protein